MSELLITICDKCPATAETRATVKTSFEVDGKSYVVDVCEEHKRELVRLTEELQSWAAIGTTVTRKAAARSRKELVETTPPPSVPTREPHVSDIRMWARRQGMEIGDRGPIPDDIVAAYMAGTEQSLKIVTSSATG